MRAGDLRRHIEFLQRTEVQDSYGDISITWAVYDKVRAAIEPLSGREYFEARAINEETTIRVRTYYLSGLDTDMRIKDVETAEVYDIESIINPDKRNRELEFICTHTNDEIG